MKEGIQIENTPEELAELKQLREENRKLLEENVALRQDLGKAELDLREARKEAMFDALTGLETRRHFRIEMEKMVSSLPEEGAKEKRREGYEHVSCVFCDIDNFKKINDEYGHEAGDNVLKRVAKVLQENIRDEDKICRWGGEEIVISFSGANEKDAAKKAEVLREKIEEQVFKEYPDLKVSLSIGVASHGKSIDTLDELLDRADNAMYKAKKTGKNKVISFSDLDADEAKEIITKKKARK